MALRPIFGPSTAVIEYADVNGVIGSDWIIHILEGYLLTESGGGVSWYLAGR